ncbi:type II toxin-antitoxin system PemK/MazF family toxin [Immundisolibacter sp.]
MPFSPTDRSTRQSKPALVVSAGRLEDDHGRLWLVMITSTRNRGGAGDVAVGNPGAAGFPVPSVIRTAKITSIESVDAAKLGTVPAALFVRVAQCLTRELAWMPGREQRHNLRNRPGSSVQSPACAHPATPVATPT